MNGIILLKVGSAASITMLPSSGRNQSNCSCLLSSSLRQSCSAEEDSGWISFELHRSRSATLCVRLREFVSVHECHHTPQLRWRPSQPKDGGMTPSSFQCRFISFFSLDSEEM